MVTKDETQEYKPVKQAFGSPGGKSYLAPKIVKMMPEHKTYVEPFAGGGAAVYFEKPPSEREVLNDKDAGISFAYRFIRDMTPEQFANLKKYDWTKRKTLFDNLKASNPQSDVEKFRKFYYLRKASFKTGGRDFNTGAEGTQVSIDRLPQIQERLKRTAVKNAPAESLLKPNDGKDTFFYCDPPYPERASVQTGGSYREDDLHGLIDKTSHLKGKVMISINKEYADAFPKDWHIQRAKVVRKLVPAQTGEITKPEYEIIATNYNPDKVKPFKGKSPRITPSFRRLK